MGGKRYSTEQIIVKLRQLREEPDPEMEDRLLEMYRRWWASATP